MLSFFFPKIEPSSVPTSGLPFFETRRTQWLKEVPQNNLLNKSRVKLNPEQFESIYKKLVLDWSPVKKDVHLGLDWVLKVIYDGWERE
ncbi:hypothetical protein HMI54_002433, partial [Coelomomyces lativittatus]